MKSIMVLGVLLIAINISGWWWFIESKTAIPSAPETADVQADVVSAFSFTLQDEVVKKIGQPIEGFEPHMFLQRFPGLVETDFEGVAASIGHYTIENGRLVHLLGEPKLVHSAATAITKDGMRTLLQNVTDRIGVDLQADGTLTDVVSALVSD